MNNQEYLVHLMSQIKIWEVYPKPKGSELCFDRDKNFIGSACKSPYNNSKLLVTPIDGNEYEVDSWKDCIVINVEEPYLPDIFFILP